MRRIGRYALALVVLLVAAVLLVGLLVMPRVIERAKDELAWTIGVAIGERVEVGSLEVTMIPAQVRVAEVTIGDPAWVVAGELELSIDLASSLSARRLQAVLAATDVEVDLARRRPDGDRRKASRSIASLPVPIDLVARVRGLAVELSDDRRVGLKVVEAAATLAGLDDVDLSAEGKSLELIGTRRVLAETFTVRAGWHDGVVTIGESAFRGPDLEIHAGSGSIEPSGGAGARVAPTEIRGGLEVGPLLEFLAGEGAVDGTASVDLQLVGSLSDPIIEGSIHVDRPSYDGSALTTAELKVTRQAGVWRADESEWVWPGGKLAGPLTLDESTLVVTGVLGWTELDPRHLTGVQVALESVCSGKATLVIDLVGSNIEVHAEGGVGRDTSRQVPFDLSVESGSTGTTGTFDLMVDEANRLRVEVESDRNERVKGAASLRVASIETVLGLLGYSGPPPARGGIDGTATLGGTLDEPVASLTISGADFRMADGSPAPIRIRADVSLAGVEIHDAVVEVGGGAVEAAGYLAISAAARNDWSLRVTNVELEPAIEWVGLSTGVPLPPVAGSVTGTWRAGGRWGSLDNSAKMDVSDARVSGRELGAVVVDVAGRGGQWHADLAARYPGGGRGKVTVGGRGRHVSRLEVDVDDWPLEQVLGANVDPIGGLIDVEGAVGIEDGLSEGRIEFDIRGLVAGDRELGDSHISAVVEEGGWQIVGRLLDGSADVGAQIRAGREMPFSGRIAWGTTTVPILGAGGDGIDLTSQGVIEANGKLADIGAVEALVRIDSLILESGEQRLVASEAVRIEVAGKAVRLAPVLLEGGLTRATVSGEWDGRGAAVVRAKGVLGLPWITPWFDAVEESTGHANLSLEVRAAVGEPVEVSGRASLQDAGLHFVGALPATGLRGEITFDGSEFRSTDLHGELGGGRFTLTGAVDIVEGPELKWGLREVSFAPAERLDMVVSGSGHLTGPWDDALLEGDLTIVELLYDRDLEIQDLLPSFDRALRPPPARRDARPPIGLDLRVHARDGLHIDNNIARIEGRTELEIGGSARSPRPRGEIEILDGQVLIRGRTFEVVNGVLSFRPELRGAAYVDFVAETVVESAGVPYNLVVRVSGTTEKYRVVLDSDEGLSQTDIASLIAFGKTMAELRAGDGTSTSSVDKLASLAGGQVGSLLSDELEQTLPFDDVELAPGFSATTGEFEPQIRLGKTITDDLSAWLTQSFGVQPQTAVEARYALTRRISAALRWQSQTDSQEGAIGGEISHRIEFWGLPTWLSWGGRD